MKRFPSILCIPVVCFASGAPVQAQTPAPPAPPARERGPAPGEGFLSRLQDLRTKLDLSEEQSSRIHALLEEDAAKARELRADASLSEEQKRQKARELFSGARQKMEPLLSAEQKKRLAEGFNPARPRDSEIPLSVEEWMTRLKEKLSLSEEQVGKIRPVLEQEVPKLRELARNRDTAPEARREAFGAALVRIGAELTPDQKEKFRQEFQRLGNRERSAGAGTSFPHTVEERLARMKDKLALSEEQVTRIKPILEEDAPKIKALAEDKSATPEARRGALRASVARIAAELTPAQREKMREEMEARRR